MSHGYPRTMWLQMSIILGCGLYTAKEQGIMGRGQYVCKFWNHHYFDWMTFVKRSGIYGVAGGIVLGTFLFGNPDIAIRRIHSKWSSYTAWGGIQNDVRNSHATYAAKL